jgi:hypothetical protein
MSDSPSAQSLREKIAATIKHEWLTQRLSRTADACRLAAADAILALPEIAALAGAPATGERERALYTAGYYAGRGLLTVDEAWARFVATPAVPREGELERPITPREAELLAEALRLEEALERAQHRYDELQAEYERYVDDCSAFATDTPASPEEAPGEREPRKDQEAGNLKAWWHGLTTDERTATLGRMNPANCPCGDGPRPGHPFGWCMPSRLWLFGEAAAQPPQRTDEGMRERPRCKCEQCSRHDAASPWISDKPGPCDCTECKAHDSCDICRGGRMDEGECCFECGNGVRTPGGALAISESDDQPTATEEAPMFHRFSECALRVLEYLRSAGEPEHTPLVMVSPIPPEDVLAAVNAICAAASALESGDQWTIEQGNALRRAAETLLLVRHREQFAARNLQDRMNAIGRRAAEHCAKLDAAQKQEWTKLGDVQPCPRCGGDAVWVRDSHDPPTYLALDLQCLSGCPHGSGLTVDNLTVAGVWGDEFSRVSDMMDSLGVDERMHLSDEPVPPSSRKEGSDE